MCQYFQAKRYYQYVDIHDVVYTLHVTERYNRIQTAINMGDFHIVDKFIVDKHHINGKEIHIITSTGLILIFNEQSKKFITVLIARPAQITRYYSAIGKKAPNYLLDISREHVRHHLNN